MKQNSAKSIKLLFMITVSLSFLLQAEPVLARTNKKNKCVELLDTLNARRPWGTLSTVADGYIFSYDSERRNIRPTYIGNFRRIMNLRPKLLTNLGVRSLGANDFFIPFPALLNQNVGKLGFNASSGLKVELIHGGELSNEEYAQKIVQNIFPIASDPDTFIHDVAVHMVGAIYFPEDVLHQIQKRLSFLLKLRNDRILSISPIFKSRVEALLANQVGFFDALTDTYSDELANPLDSEQRRRTNMRSVYTQTYMNNFEDLFSFEKQTVCIPYCQEWYWQKDLSWLLRKRLVYITRDVREADLSMEEILEAFAAKSQSLPTDLSY